jgi:hypothetical protein
MSKPRKHVKRPSPPMRAPGPVRNRRVNNRPLEPARQQDIFERGDEALQPGEVIDAGLGEMLFSHELDLPEVPRFALLVDCDDEKAMQVLLAELIARGVRVRPIPSVLS